MEVKRCGFRTWIIYVGIAIGVTGAGCGGGVANKDGFRVTDSVMMAIIDSIVKKHVSIILDSISCTAASKNVMLEEKFRAMGLVNIRELEPSIAVHIVYATPFNFVGKILYKNLDKAYMLSETAERLIDAQKRLKAMRPDLSLIVYDAARPLSVQREMWEIVKGTDRMMYVRNPEHGGLHNFGAAVDVSLVDCTGKALEMGCEYDFFGDKAHITHEDLLIKQQQITSRELANRLLLRKVMTDAGFKTIENEWWHFNLVSLKEAKERLQLIE